MNLPLLLKALGNRRMPLEDLAPLLIESAKNAIVPVLAPEPEPGASPDDPRGDDRAAG